MQRCLLFFFFLLLSSSGVKGQSHPDSSLLKSEAPEIYQIRFSTTKGSFVLEVCRSCSPNGADRLYQLVKTGFYNNSSIFRVQPEFVIQFGISDNKAVNDFWEKRPIPDEPVVKCNVRGSVSYARDGAESRTVQLFINMKDNPKLDTVNFNGLRGFPPFAKVVEGFEVVQSFYSGYGFEPANHQDSIMIYGNAYMKKQFPELDYIISAEFVDE